MGSSIAKRLKFEDSLKDLKKLSFWRDVSCELWISTFMIAVVILILTSNNTEKYKPNILHFGLYAIFFVYMILEAYAPISNIANPPLTFCLFLAGKMSFARAAIYTVVQVLGCAAGSGIGCALTPPKNRNYTAYNPENNGLSLVQAVFVEAFFTWNAYLVALLALGGDFERKFPILPNFAVGCAYGTAVLAAGTFTGTFMNPLISLGPAILTGDFRNHWIYWVGPYIGGIPAVYLYKFYVWVKIKEETIPKRAVPVPTEAEPKESDY